LGDFLGEVSGYDLWYAMTQKLARVLIKQAVLKEVYINNFWLYM